MPDLRKNTFFVSLGQGVQLLLALLLMPFAARFLGDADFGRYSLASTLMFFVFLANDLGLNTWLTREAARARDSSGRLLARVLGIKLAAVPVAYGLLLAFLALSGFDEVTRRAVEIFAVYGIVSSLGQAFTAIFRAHERMHFETLVVVTEKLLITGLGLFVLVRRFGVEEFSAVFPLAGFVSAALAAYLVWKRFFRPVVAFDTRAWPATLGASVAFGVSIFLATVYNKIDVVMLSMMQSVAVVGWYSAAYKLLAFTNVVPNIAATVLFPRLSVYSKAGREQLSELFGQAILYLSALAVPMIPGGILLAPGIIHTVFGAEYVQAVPALQILVVAAGILFLNIFLASLYGAANFQTKLVGIQTLGLILNVGLNWILIPRFAHLGAAAATVATEGTIFVVTITLAVRRIARPAGLAELWKVFVAAAVMTVGLTYLRHWNWLVLVGVGAALYAGALWLLNFKPLRTLKRGGLR